MCARFVVLALLIAAFPSASASADWLLTPFVGYKFGGDTTLFEPERAAGQRKFTFGGSFALLTDGILGAQMEFAYIPGYFHRDDPQNRVVGSGVLTWGGDVIVAVPLSVSRDGLRPYVIGGLGWLRASIDGAEDIVDVTTDMLAMSIGGGAIGRVTSRASVRFELRQYRNLTHPTEELTFGDTRLTLWRGTVGVTFHY